MARVVIADDSPSWRVWLERSLTDLGHEVVAVAVNGDQVQAMIEAQVPDLVVCDLDLPPRGRRQGFEIAAYVRGNYPRMAILVVSQYNEPSLAHEFIRHGARRIGYLLKHTAFESPALLGDVIDSLLKGWSRVDPDVIDEQLKLKRLDGLTPSQREILAMVAEGLSNAAIAKRRGQKNSKGVEEHLTAVYAKLGIPPHADRSQRVLATHIFLATTRKIPELPD